MARRVFTRPLTGRRIVDASLPLRRRDDTLTLRLDDGDLHVLKAVIDPQGRASLVHCIIPKGTTTH